MLENIQKVDSWIIEKIFQKISDWVWEYVDLNCFDLAKIALLVHCLILVYISEYRGASVLMIGLIAAINLPWIFSIESEFNPKFKNPIRISPIYSIIRIMVMINGFVLTLSPPWYISNFNYLLYPVMMFFVSCQKRPPVERRKLVFADIFP